jgi:parallel beta-helix repeat protein
MMHSTSLAKYASVVITLALFVGIGWAAFGTVRVVAEPKAAYTNEWPIIIDGNSELATFIAAKGLSGDGTQNTPYSIANLNITGNTSVEALILISNTNAYFNISSCLLLANSANHSIMLVNVTNAVIWNNTIQSALYAGIYVYNSANIVIKENVISQCGAPGDRGSPGTIISYGISTLMCTNLLIEANEVFNNNRGIGVKTDTNSQVVGNKVHENTYGVWVFGDSIGTLVKLNEIFNLINGSALKLESSTFINISQNSLFNTTDFAIEIRSGFMDSIISKNNIFGSTSDDWTGAPLLSPQLLNVTFSENYWGDPTWNGTGAYINFLGIIDSTPVLTPYNYGHNIPAAVTYASPQTTQSTTSSTTSSSNPDDEKKIPGFPILILLGILASTSLLLSKRFRK